MSLGSTRSNHEPQLDGPHKQTPDTQQQQQQRTHKQGDTTSSPSHNPDAPVWEVADVVVEESGFVRCKREKVSCSSPGPEQQLMQLDKTK